MTDQLPPRRSSVDRELEPRSTAPAPEDPNAWPHAMPPPPPGGSDPTTPAVELDPDRLAAMLPRSRRH